MSEQPRPRKPTRRQARRSGRRITSVDVAAEAGVSQATVARAFSAPDKVTPTTRAKVHDAADRLGYVPNAIARSLKSQRTNIVGAVVPAVGEYWQNVMTSFSRRLGEVGQQLLIFSFTDPSDVQRAMATVDQYRLDGLILGSATIGARQLARTAGRTATAIPVVAFNQPAASGVLPSVSVDNEAGTRSLAEHLVEVGASTAVFIGGVESASTDRLRYRGAVSTLGDHGVACPYLEAGAFSYDAGFRVATGLLERPHRPDAVMVASDELAFGVIDGLRTAGVRIPEDVLVTGFDGLPQAAWAAYDLTTLVQDTDVLVKRAVEVLLDQIDELEPEADVSADRGAEPDVSADRGAEAEPDGDPDVSASPDVVVSGTVRLGRTTTGVAGEPPRPSRPRT